MTLGIAIALVVAAAGITVFVGAGKLAAGRRVTARSVGSFGLLVVLSAFFYLFCVLTPQAAGNRWLGMILIAGCAGIFRLMTRFESSR
jgi:hypothetical protein